MSKILSELLTYPFEKEQLEFPENRGNILIWGAQYTKNLANLKADWVQEFKPYADHLTANSVSSFCAPPLNKKYNYALCCLPKQKEEALYLLACALDCLDKDGLLLAGAANDAGGKRLDKWFHDLGLNAQNLSKSKCRIVWAYKKNPSQEKIKKFISQGSVRKIKLGNDEFFTKPGIYGWNKIDVGSKLLVENITDDLSETGADFGCGYGYIANKILNGNKKVKKIYAIDADYNAVECCKKNLEKYQKDYSIEYQWKDLSVKSDDLKNLDWIVMNPPFHEGKNTDTDLGRKFIENAAASLRKGGALYMVANAHLPYEAILTGFFDKVEKIIENQGFKVFKAIK